MIQCSGFVRSETSGIIDDLPDIDLTIIRPDIPTLDTLLKSLHQ